jgi:hypothetical protein
MQPIRSASNTRKPREPRTELRIIANDRPLSFEKEPLETEEL